MIYNLTPEQMVDLMNNPLFVLCLIIVSIWSLIWKGLALWRAGRLNDKVWFIVLLVANTVGILEIIYLFIVLKRRDKKLPMNPV